MTRDLKSRVGQWNFNWKAIPAGEEGTCHVAVQGKTGQDGNPGNVEGNLEVKWKRDAQGLWITLPHGVFGFDLMTTQDEDGRLGYQVLQRNSSQAWKEVSCTLGDIENLSANRSSRAKGARIRAQMPGKIIRILVTPGQAVEKDQPIAVMEAMKMENEIRAVQTGKISEVRVVEGQAVETGADLMLIEV